MALLVNMNQKKVMVIASVSEIQEELRIPLEMHGYPVEAFGSYGSALGTLKQNGIGAYGLVIFDADDLVTEGVVRGIRSRYPKLPIFALTSDDNLLDDPENAKEVTGADHIITAPPDVDAFVGLVRQYLIGP